MPASPFIGEIMPFAGNFAPIGWLPCDGSLQSIANFEVLFQLIGTTYGGDGQATFAVPNLNGRACVHAGTLAGVTRVIGQVGGSETATLTVPNLPPHSHLIATAASGIAPIGTGRIPAPSRVGDPAYGPPPQAGGAMTTGTVSTVGGSQSHENMQPYQVVTFCIAYEGIFPSPA